MMVVANSFFFFFFLFSLGFRCWTPFHDGTPFIFDSNGRQEVVGDRLVFFPFLWSLLQGSASLSRFLLVGGWMAER